MTNPTPQPTKGVSEKPTSASKALNKQADKLSEILNIMAETYCQLGESNFAPSRTRPMKAGTAYKEEILKWVKVEILKIIGEDELVYPDPDTDSKTMLRPRRKSGVWYQNKLRAKQRQSLERKLEESVIL